MEQLEKEKIFKFLDGLQESGVTNMFGASSFLSKRFGTNRQDSISILAEWMETWEERHKT